MEKQLTYLTTEELAERLRYDASYIRNCLKDVVLVEGIHYFKPFGRRKILYIWEEIEKDMKKSSFEKKCIIPLSRGRICHG